MARKLPGSKSTVPILTGALPRNRSSGGSWRFPPVADGDYNRDMMKLELPLQSGQAPLRGLLDVPAPELCDWLRERGQPPLRARQLRRWIVAGRATSFEQMTDLPKGLRADLPG